MTLSFNAAEDLERLAVKRSFLQKKKKKKCASDDQLSLVALDSPVLLSPSIVSFFFSSLLTDTSRESCVTWTDDMFTFFRTRKVLDKIHTIHNARSYIFWPDIHVCFPKTAEFNRVSARFT